jgi:pimeloyl-ACP methyl ester carboxylesterase
MIADDVAALLRELQVERAHILGASFGGFVAQEFALAYPLLTESLILCCTSFGGPNHVPPPLTTLQAIASTKGLNTEDRVRENLLLAFSGDYLTEQRAEVERVIELRAANPVPEYAYQHQLQAAIVFNTEARVSEIKAPTLVLTGSLDIIVPYVNSLNLAARIPGARLRIIEGGSHTFFIERAAEFNQAVTEFIESTSVAAA